MATSILIAESGSTKTDWCRIENGKRQYISSSGINPLLQTEDAIVSMLQSELPKGLLNKTYEAIYFYGAGVKDTTQKKMLQHVLRHFFSVKKTEVASDLLGSARALCANEPGIVCILGTGSNTAYYTGKTLGFKTKSLGYLLGDEGSGNALGKKVLQYYLHGIFDSFLMQAFEEMYPDREADIMQHLYRQPFPNRYLATFASFLFRHRGHFMVENIIEDALNDFFLTHLIRYPHIHRLPVHFSGSIAFYLQEELRQICGQYEMQTGLIVQKPIQRLAAFHLANQR